MNAASRCGSVKVWNISSAVVRNSSLAVTVVVLTDEVPWVCVTEEVAFSGCLSFDGCHVGVEKPLEGFEPV